MSLLAGVFTRVHIDGPAKAWHLGEPGPDAAALRGVQELALLSRGYKLGGRQLGSFPTTALRLWAAVLCPASCAGESLDVGSK